jgi:transcriptional regulator with XRE-family HTH domain
MTTFGEKLKQLRDQAGVTQAVLAEGSGVPIGTIRDYEQTKRDPLLPTVVRLARALDVSLDEFAECVGKDAAPATPPAVLGRPARVKEAAAAKVSPKKGRKK